MQKRVLIIEDEQLNREAMVKKFTTEGFEVLESDNGTEGLATALQVHPDLIILDVLLPEMGGFAVMENIRKDPWGEHVPIIILTNLSGDYSKSQSVVKDRPLVFFEKVNTPLDVVIAKAKEVLLQEHKAA